MNVDFAALPDTASDLKEIITTLADTYKKSEEKNQARIKFLEERIRLLQNELFGRKTEKSPKPDQKQLLLFPEMPEEFDDDDPADEITVPHTNAKSKAGSPFPTICPVSRWLSISMRKTRSAPAGVN